MLIIVSLRFIWEKMFVNLIIIKINWEVGNLFLIRIKEDFGRDYFN